MILPLESPPKLVLSGNTVVARLASNNYVTSLGSPAVFIFRFTAAEANGATFAFGSEGAGNFIFTFKSVVDPNSPTDLRLKGGMSDLLWHQTILKSLESNFYLEQAYFITEAEVSGNPAIKLVAREPGSKWTITLGEGTVANMSELTNTAGTNRTVRDNFRMLVETYTKGLVNFRLRGKGDLISVDKEGVGVAQVNAYLEDRLEQQFAWPVQALTPVGFRNHMAQKSYLRYGEIYGIPEQVYKMTKSPEFVTLQGRLPKKRMVDFFNRYSTLLDYFKAAKRFLSWQPLTKETYSDSPEKLYWLHYYEDVAQIKIRIKRVLTDGSSTTFDFSSLFTVSAFSVVEIDTAVKVMAPGITNLAELHVWVSRADNLILSAVQVYLINPVKPAILHHYLFENAWGTYDAIAFSGELIESDNYTREVEETFRPQLYNQPQRRFRNYKTQHNELFTVHSGYTEDNDWLLWVDDLLNSPSVYEVINNELHEVMIESGEVFKKRSNEFLKAISFKYQRHAPEQVYRIAPVGVISEIPQIDDTLPAPQFVAQQLVGLAGLEEMYFPGNAWLNLSETMPETTSLVITAVLRIELGEVILFSEEETNTIISLNAAGNVLTISSNDGTIDMDLSEDIRNKYILLQISIAGGVAQTWVNGSMIGTGSFEGEFNAGVSKFGRGSDSEGLYIGRLNDLKLGTSEDLNNDEIILNLAERWGLPVPGANWLNRFDEETRALIFDEWLTRDDVTLGYIQMSRAAMPYFSPAPGHRIAPFSTGIFTDTFGAVLYFTLDGTEPTNESTLYDPENPPASEGPVTIKAIAYAEGYLPSQVATAVYTLLPTATPTLTPSDGEHDSPLGVVPASETEDAVFYFTVDGSTPTTSSPSPPISLTAPPESSVETTLKVIAQAPGHAISEVAEATYTVNNFARGLELEFTVSGAAAGRTITLPLIAGGYYDAYVDWGDGTPESHITAFNSVARIHTYAAAGVYTISITGSLPSLKFNNGGDRLKLTDIVYWGDPDAIEPFAAIWGMFYGCSNCRSLGMGKPRATSGSVEDAFRDMTSITSIPVGLLDLITVATNFASTFYGCTGITSIPADLFRYNTSATTFAACFLNCTGLTSIPADIFRYNVLVTNFSSVFSGCTGITSIPNDIFRYNTSVTAFLNVFQNCTGLTSLPTDLFRYNTLANNFQAVFSGCSNLATVPALLFKYNLLVTNFVNAFLFCNKLQLRIDIFYASGEHTTRFLNRSVQFTNCFNKNGWTGIQGTAPDLWTCSFGSGTPTRTACYGGIGNSSTSLTNFASIPAEWK